MSRLVLLGVAALTACTSSGPRPIAPSAEEVIQAPLRVVQAATLQAATNLGLPLRASAVPGQVETEYVDIQTYRPEASQYPVPERLIRFILNATQDPNSSGAIVAIRAVYNPFRSGLSDTRRGERAVPRSHPAMDVVRDLVADIRKTAEGG